MREFYDFRYVLQRKQSSNSTFILRDIGRCAWKAFQFDSLSTGRFVRTNGSVWNPVNEFQNCWDLRGSHVKILLNSHKIVETFRNTYNPFY